MSTSVAGPITFKNIFFASDFTASSERALGYARALAKHYGAHLTVVHVCRGADRISIPEGGWIEDLTKYHREEEQLKALAEQLRSEGFDAEGLCAKGGVEDAMASLAEERHADLLVAGTQGRTGFNRLLYGSRAEGIARRATVPMLFAGPHVPALETPAWELKHVLCGVPIRSESAPIAAYAYRLAHGAGATFFLYYLDDHHAPARSDERRAIAVEIRKYLEAYGVEHLHDFAYLHEKPAEELVGMAVKSRASVIVLTAESSLLNLSRFHRNNVAHVLAEAPCPVLVLPNR
jgi:nucleotide-binding universal stress UspA family protein